MKRKIKIILLGKTIILLFLVTIILIAPRTIQAHVESENEGQPKLNSMNYYNEKFVENIVIVTMTKEATRQFLNYTPAHFAEVNAIDIEDLTALTVDWVRKQVLGIPTDQQMRVNVEKFRRILSIKLDIYCRENVLNAVYILSQRADIQSASPSFTIEMASALPNDPMMNDLWAFTNINLYPAWHLSTGSSSVTVAVIDSGIQYNHPDLINRIHRSVPHHNINTTLHRDFITSNDIQGEPILYPVDYNGHGTHVAGTIGAQGNNGVGVTGVAWDVRLVSLRVFDDEGFIGNEAILHRAISFAKLQNIDIINFSGTAPHYSSIYNAIAAFDGLFVAAAGNDTRDNDGSLPAYPASFRLDNLISVGAIDNNNERVRSSNWGANTVCIWAPGSDILSTVPKGFTPYGTIRHSEGYAYAEGTSMAAPHVTGVAALMLSINPRLTPQQLRNAILNSASQITISHPSGFLNLGTGYQTVRRLNAFYAVRSVATFDTRIGSNPETIYIIGTFNRPLEGNLYVPATINNRTVVRIGPSAFINQVYLDNITIPNSVTQIGRNALAAPNATIRFTEDRHIIQDSLLEGSGMRRVYLPHSIEIIGYRAFADNGNLNQNINIPVSVHTIGRHAFSNISPSISINLEGVRQVPSGFHRDWNPHNNEVLFDNIRCDHQWHNQGYIRVCHRCTHKEVAPVLAPIVTSGRQIRNPNGFSVDVWVRYNAGTWDGGIIWYVVHRHLSSNARFDLRPQMFSFGSVEVWFVANGMESPITISSNIGITPPMSLLAPVQVGHRLLNNNPVAVNVWMLLCHGECCCIHLIVQVGSNVLPGQLWHICCCYFSTHWREVQVWFALTCGLSSYVIWPCGWCCSTK